MAGVVHVEDVEAGGGFGGVAVPAEDVARVRVAVEDRGDVVVLDELVIGVDIAGVPLFLEVRGVGGVRGPGVAGEVDVMREDDGHLALADVFLQVGFEEREAFERVVAAGLGRFLGLADDDAEVDETGRAPSSRRSAGR